MTNVRQLDAYVDTSTELMCEYCGEPINDGRRVHFMHEHCHEKMNEEISRVCEIQEGWEIIC